MRFIVIILVSFIFFSTGCSGSGSNVRFESKSGTQQKQVRHQVVKGINLFKANKPDESAAVFRNILRKDNNVLIAKEMLAIISFKQNDIQAAERYARMSLKQNAKSAKAHLVLAGVFKQRGNALAMRDHLRKAKKFATDKEIENLKEFVQQNNLDLKAKAAEIKVNDSLSKYRVRATGNKPFIAVFTFEYNQENTEQNNIGSTASEMLMTALIQSDVYQIMERSQLDKVLEEQALGLSGALDQETAVDVGQLLGVDAVVVGSVAKLNRQIELDARIVDAGSGKAHVAANASAADEANLRNAVNELARKLAAGSAKVPVNKDADSTMINEQ